MASTISKVNKRQIPILIFCIVLGLGILFSLNKASELYKTKTTVGTYDVIVIGAGPGGIGATLQAARMGEKVALIEQTDWLGGQMTAAGVGTMDEDSLLTRNSGIYKEFVSRAVAYYSARNKSVSTCYFGTNNLCIDPSVGQQIIRQMLTDAGSNLHVFTGVKVTGVTKQGNIVNGITTDKLGKLNSRVVIDASEFGDVLSMANVPFRLGTGTDSSPDTSSCIQTISYAAILKYYPDGVPLKLIFTHVPPGYNATIANHFKNYLSENGHDYIKEHKHPYTFQSYTAYRGLPDLTNPQDYNALQQDGHTITRTALILGNDFPLNARLNSQFISNKSVRTQDICDAKLLTLQLIYYIQHDLHQSNWSIADDEGYNTDYANQNHCQNLNGYEQFEVQMAQEPYIREGRRIIGEETLTSASMLRPWTATNSMPEFKDSVAVGYYPMDLHGCSQIKDLEKNLDAPSSLASVNESGPFEVPIGVLIPQSVDGILAAEKNISTSRLANGAVRVQPISLDIGQAAGALAAMAAKKNIQPRYVNVNDVQAELIKSGAVIHASDASTTK